MLLSIIFSLILFSVFNPVVIFFEKRGLSRKQSAFIILGVVVFSSGLVIVFYVSPLLSKMPYILSHDLPLYLENFYKRLDTIYGYLLREVPSLNSINIRERINEAAAIFPQKIAQAAINIIPQAVVILTLTPLFTFFLIKDGNKLKKWFISLVPNNYFEMALHLLHRVNTQWTQYIRGKVLETLILSVVVIVLFIPTGLEYIVPLGLFVGITCIIPYLGQFIGAIPVLAVALMLDLSPGMIVYLLIVVFVIAHIVDNLILMPIFISKYAHLHSLAVIISIIAGERLMGIMGMIIGIPIVSMLNLLIQEIYAFYKFKGSTREFV